jgi:hypothetical protein
MKTFVWILLVLLVILHQDEFFWDSTTLMGGVVPVGMAWHMGISVVSAFVWYLATVYAWPADDLSEVPVGERSRES